MDDLEGQEAAYGTTAQAMMAAGADNTSTAQAEMRGPINQDPRTQLPQDPIPVYEGKTLVTNGPRPTK